MSQLQHVEEDSLARGDPPTDMSQLQHSEEVALVSGDVPCRHVPATTCLGRLTGQWRYPFRRVPATFWGRRIGQWRQPPPPPPPPQTCPSYNFLRKTRWHWRPPCRPSSVPTKSDSEAYPADMPQQHADEDSLASEDPHPPSLHPSSTAHGRNWRGQLDSPWKLDCLCVQRTTVQDGGHFYSAVAYLTDKTKSIGTGAQVPRP